jgi:hypothetical protein
VKIKSLTIQGFRGFNEERTIELNEKLTLISAPNSYGKTSVSEALEWLLYQITSKVENADSKDEYKGSYRNRHLSGSLTPYVKVCFNDCGKEIEFIGELAMDDTVKKSVVADGKAVEVDCWPLPEDILAYPRPFILQHALKYLLLTKPDDRFKGFARLLGLEILDNIQTDIISLCTAPERRIPPEVKALQSKVSTYEIHLANRPALISIYKLLKRKEVAYDVVMEAIKKECLKRVPVGTDEEAFLPQLLKIREETVGKVFKGRINLIDYTQLEKLQNSEDGKLFLKFLTDSFVKDYLELIVLANVDQILKQAKFLDLGFEILDQTAGVCPFCDCQLNEEVTKHIVEKHDNITDQAKISQALEAKRSLVLTNLKSMFDRLAAFQTNHVAKIKPFIDVADYLEDLETIFAAKNETFFKKLKLNISDLTTSKKNLESAYQVVCDANALVLKSIETCAENSDLIMSLRDALVAYVSEARSYAENVSSRVPLVENIDQVLQHELDILAGTEDISLLIDLLDNSLFIKKKTEIDRILASLKDLRSSVDSFVADRMLSAIKGELTCGVMEWYDQIKTTTDPDVHFDGFDMERNQKGELKARRVKIKAKSYNQELVSAVSSLSESKLNALGLCVSIATCLKGQSVFDFLIIDDPIQSLDSEHEAQFVSIIRNLVEKCGKQVILLSHNRPWLNQVKAGCQSLNGWFYEFTGYTQVGPYISIVAWEQWQERLKGVKAILSDPNSDSIKLQQAEEEIRIAVGDITTELYKKVKGIKKSPHDLNSSKVKNILTECGVRTELVNRISQTFCTTDDSHHAPRSYSPNRDRIMKYHSWTYELAKYLAKD